MKLKSVEIEVKHKEIKIANGITREDLVNRLGEPDYISMTSKSCKNGRVLVYNGYELHFDGCNAESKIFLIYKEDDRGVVDTSVKFS